MAKKMPHPVALLSELLLSTKNTMAVMASSMIASTNATQTAIFGRKWTSNIQIILIPTEMPKLVSKMSIELSESDNRLILVA